MAQMCDVRKSPDAITEKINLQKVLASLYIICIEYQAKIEPSQILRVNDYEIKCPFCDERFHSSTKGEREGSDL